jgi:hypothetical protein
MVLWTAFLVADLVQLALSSGLLASPAEGEAVPAALDRGYRTVRDVIWGSAAQARAIVWGLPMIVFALVAAITRN